MRQGKLHLKINKNEKRQLREGKRREKQKRKDWADSRAVDTFDCPQEQKKALTLQGHKEAELHKQAKLASNYPNMKKMDKKGKHALAGKSALYKSLAYL
jgi:hypothetical protein